MNNSNGDKTRNERFLDALVKELQSMSDTDVLEGENAEDLVKLGERLLNTAREEAGVRRMANAKIKLSAVSTSRNVSRLPSAAEARDYLSSLPNLTLAARKLSELSDTDVLDLYIQTQSLIDQLNSDTGNDET